MGLVEQPLTLMGSTNYVMGRIKLSHLEVSMVYFKRKTIYNILFKSAVMVKYLLAF